MPLTSTGQSQPEALLQILTDSAVSGSQVYGPLNIATVTFTAPAGYTAALDSSNNLVVTGPPSSNPGVAVGVKQGTTTIATLNVPVWPAVAELSALKDTATSALSTANSATTTANNASATANAASTTATQAQTTANQALTAANSAGTSNMAMALFVRKNPPATGATDGTWPARPSSSSAVLVFWDGPPNADGSGPPTAASGTGGMLPGDKWLNHP